MAARPAPPAETSTAQFAGYDRKMITTFEVVVAYFVDIVYNHIYRHAGTTQSKKSDESSLTDEYRKQVHAYVVGVKTDERCFKDTTTGLHGFFSAYYPMPSYASFVDWIVKYFVPEDYFAMMKIPERDEMMSSIICELVAGIAVFATKPEMLQRIIDARDSQREVTTRMMQDHGITVLISKRDVIYNQFLKRVGQARETVPMDMIDDMKKALRRLAREKADERAKALMALNELKKLRETIRQFRIRETKFKQLIERMRSGPRHGSAHGRNIPRPDTIAEDPLDPDDSTGVPEANTLGEVSDPIPDDEGSHRGQNPTKHTRKSQDSTKAVPYRFRGDSRYAKKGSARTPQISADFFKTTPVAQPTKAPPRDDVADLNDDLVTASSLRPDEQTEPEADGLVEDVHTELTAAAEAPDDDDEPVTLFGNGVRRSAAPS